MNSKKVHIIGAGLAGSEAAYFLAQRGVQVVLHEMRPIKLTPAHQTGSFAELVCSNSLKSQNPKSAPGMLKAEMQSIGSLILEMGNRFHVPAGESLAVDRELFSEAITQELRNHPNIEVVNDEVTKPIDGHINLIATGPLTSDSLTNWLMSATQSDSLYFYDAIAPILEAESIWVDPTHPSAAFLGNRYNKGGEEAYLNCPLTKEEYEAFIDAILAGEKVVPKNFEKEKFFQGCQPIEAIAATGRESLRFGPMKPVGLDHPATGRYPYAAVQLRTENQSKTAYNMVGFQTKLKYPEQQRIFKMIPALKNAEFLRMGSIHRNTYVCGPKALYPDLSLRGNPNIYLAGQITGVEGYLESAACGMLSAMSILQRIQNKRPYLPEANTALGCLLRHVTASDPKNYQPSNIHFGLFDPQFYQTQLNKESDQPKGLKKEVMREIYISQSIENFKRWKQLQSL